MKENILRYVDEAVRHQKSLAGRRRWEGERWGVEVVTSCWLIPEFSAFYVVFGLLIISA